MTSADSQALLIVASIWGIAVLSPGPNMVLLAHVTLSNGRPAALRVILGLLSATLLWSLFAWLGLRTAVALAPQALGLLKLIGGAYLAYLGLRLILASRHLDTPAAPPMAPAPHHHLRLGFLTNITNPKTAAFMASIFVTAFPAEPSFTTGVAAMGIIVAMSGAFYLGLTTLLATPATAKAYRAAKGWIDRLAGGIFMAFGAKLATE
ncbi:MAG: LysE family translocator [Candidatus Competibacterales bacterium]